MAKNRSIGQVGEDGCGVESTGSKRGDIRRILGCRTRATAREAVSESHLKCNLLTYSYDAEALERDSKTKDEQLAEREEESRQKTEVLEKTVAELRAQVANGMTASAEHMSTLDKLQSTKDELEGSRQQISQFEATITSLAAELEQQRERQSVSRLKYNL